MSMPFCAVPISESRHASCERSSHSALRLCAENDVAVVADFPAACRATLFRSHVVRR